MDAAGEERRERATIPLVAKHMRAGALIDQVQSASIAVPTDDESGTQKVASAAIAGQFDVLEIGKEAKYVLPLRPLAPCRIDVTERVWPNKPRMKGDKFEKFYEAMRK